MGALIASWWKLGPPSRESCLSWYENRRPCSSGSPFRACSRPGPKLLTLDEPTERIQPSIIEDIGRVICMPADRGMALGQRMAFVLVEQFYDFAAELADQYIVIERGEIIPRGRSENMEAEGVRALRSI